MTEHVGTSGGDQCQVCHSNIKKYKCPACQILYCCLDCYKVHKSEELCQKRQEEIGFVVDREPAVDRGISGLDDKTLLIDEIADQNILSLETLEKLGESDEVRGLLSNPHLRDYLSLLNSKDYPRGLLRNAMQEPLFLEFANACLKTIHPEQNAREITDEEIVQKIQDSINQ